MTGGAVPLAVTGARWQSRAIYLAERFGLPLATDTDSGRFLLVVGEAGLELRQVGSGASGPVRIDFAAGPMGYRARHGGGRGQPLARAAGLQKRRSPRLLDATAGLGRDAFVLASLGCEVVLLERSPVIAALLHDGLERALHDERTRAPAQRMQLLHVDAIDYLTGLRRPAIPDVIYLDPMYPQRQKSALVKKEMRLFRQLVGDDDDASRLLAVARKKARYRVLVKRPAGASCVEGDKPSMEICGPRTRYDIYVRQAFPQGSEAEAG